jgi:hypothetical protein
MSYSYGQSQPTRRSPIIAIVLALLIIGGGALGGVWYMRAQRKQAATDTARKFLDAHIAANWTTVVDMMYFSPEMVEQYRRETNGQVAPREAIFAGLQGTEKRRRYVEAKVGATTVQGDTAAVSTTVTIETQRGTRRTWTEDLPLQWVEGAWKVDVAKTIDKEKALGK